MFLLKLVINILAVYFAIRVLYTAIILDNSAETNIDYLLFSMLFFLGLSNTVQLVEMVRDKKKEHFTLLLVSTILLFGVSVAIFLSSSIGGEVF
ncbi:hypothetical protein P6709_10040 [Jeotgalibacillus sp. ET6]|uniref:hypothetical protein n=1 Tax=Jeotgalibacillus sp. ET6 TaxID=3037260 RepID=UPI002418B6C9|nr:hypothetical protein [Jeotgalibacillus sp. ET6]MDG5472092.1 hypothetical protein [Jeotgalibacillus sp. ET6]